MKTTLVLLLAATLFLVTPVAAMARGGHPAGNSRVHKTQVVTHTTSYHYYGPGFQQSRHAKYPPRHVHRSAQIRQHHNKRPVVKHYTPVPVRQSGIVVAVPQIVIRIGF